MDEIADCIADHQYGEAIRKSGVGDPMDALATSIVERIPEPSPIKDEEERKRVNDEFAKGCKLSEMLNEPLGRYMLAWMGVKLGKMEDKDMDGIVKVLDEIQDFEKAQRPDHLDVQVVCDTLMESCPSDYVKLVDDISKHATIAGHELEKKQSIAIMQVEQKQSESTDEPEEKEEKESTAQQVAEDDQPDPDVPDENNFTQVFHDFKEKLTKEFLEPHFEAFKADPLCERYRNLKWYYKQPITIDNFIVFRDLGRGAFGVVSGGRLRTTGQMCALKGMNRKLVKGKKVKKLVKGEKEILKLLGERPSLFCVWLKYSFMDSNNMYFALPLMTGGDLQYHLRKEAKTFGIERTRFFAAEIMLGLAHMHSLGIVYRDLKPENVLLDDEGHTRISDMGLAYATKFTPSTRGNKTIKGKAGTPGYWPPQMIRGEGYAFDADWWSFGCCLYEFMAGYCPFSEHYTKMKDRNDGTLNWEIQFPDAASGKEFPEDLKDLILKLLDRDANTRFGSGGDSAEPIMHHKFFETIDWKKLSRHQIPPPWSPPKDAINAVSQADLEDRNKEYEYRKLKLTEEDDIAEFDYTSNVSHQRDICTVLKLERLGKLDHLQKRSRSSACALL